MKVSKVKLRKKALTDGKRKSLYLDFWPQIVNPKTGKLTRRESLGMYIWVKPSNEVQKMHNKNTLFRAEKILSERQSSIYSNNYGFLATEIENEDFLAYFNKLAIKRGRSFSNRAIWLIVLEYLKSFSSEIKVKDITVSFIHDFREFLLTKKHFKTGRCISKNTASSYFSKLIFALKAAYKDGLLKENIAPKIDRIKNVETKKEFLTKEEATKLKETPCKDSLQKKVCLFMIYTGLRVSDVLKLKWANLEHSNENGYYIRFQHQKTGTQQTLPIKNEAFDLLPERKNLDEQIFKGFHKDYRILKEWAKNASISKNVTFNNDKEFLKGIFNEEVDKNVVKI